MKILLTTAFVISLGIGQAALAQGPVRDGLRQAGGAAVQGTRNAVGAAADATRAVGRATLNTVERAGEGARNVAGATAQGIRGGVDALTPNIPAQARIDAQGPIDRNAQWRFARHNDEWWYYTPRNEWMYHRHNQWNDFTADKFQPLAQPYSVGYRGVEGATGQLPASQTIRTDRYGREYICDNGRPVYLDETHGAPQPLDDRGEPDYAPPRPAEASGVNPQPSLQEQATPATASDANTQHAVPEKADN